MIMAKPTKKAVVLLSGGLDSATCLAIAKSHKVLSVMRLSLDYHQRHIAELQAAQNIASSLRCN
jgi:7-cyano-7-deazaguanine synthase